LALFSKDNQHIIFTHDLDFGAILAVTQANAPSVVQVRTQNIVPEAIGDMVVNAIHRFRQELLQGALLSIDPERARIRILPINP
jgi:predicted nuclease of predicted toxin-antitoxin system